MTDTTPCSFIFHTISLLCLTVFSPLPALTCCCCCCVDVLMCGCAWVCVKHTPIWIHWGLPNATSVFREKTISPMTQGGSINERTRSELWFTFLCWTSVKMHFINQEQFSLTVLKPSSLKPHMNCVQLPIVTESLWSLFFFGIILSLLLPVYLFFVTCKEKLPQEGIYCTVATKLCPFTSDWKHYSRYCKRCLYTIFPASSCLSLCIYEITTAGLRACLIDGFPSIN